MSSLGSGRRRSGISVQTLVYFRRLPAAHARITVVPIAMASDISLRRPRLESVQRPVASQMGGVEEQHLVATFNLDWLLARFRTPNIVKIDAEGAEREVLRNQHRILNEVRPHMRGGTSNG